MAANIDPIFTRVPDIGLAGAVAGPTANTNLDGTSSSTSMVQVYQADATNGSYLEKIILKAVGSPAATVVRIFICTVSGSFTMGTDNTAANTSMVGELQLPAITLSQTAPSPQFEIPLGYGIPAGYRVLASFGTSTGASGTGYNPVMIAGKY